MRTRVRLGLLAAVLASSQPAAAAGAPVTPAAAGPDHPPARADFVGASASAAVREVADWAVASGDHNGLPFVIIDKVAAKVLAFDRRGVLLGAAPALFGLARGDVSPPGIGNRKLATITPAERITPAGRFVAALGRNIGGQDILWVDYDAAVSLHRVIAGKPGERRLERLATASPRDNRISYGCINVPVAFYESVVAPLFEATTGIVYILPETRPVRDVFAVAP